MIDVINCTQRYGVRPILRDVNLRVERGELVALMGPNGMGKSTLLSVMAGILPPVKGYVAIDGKRRRESKEIEAAIRRMVVYLPADSFLPPLQGAQEWLLGVGRLYEHDDDYLMDHAERLLALFDLDKLADTRMSSYSSGQRRKIALAAALITEAPVMLLDEPFSGGLDPSGILALKRVLQGLRDTRKVTVVMATPVPELVEDLADRIAVLQEGRLIAYETIEGLRKLSGSSGKLDEIYDVLLGSQKAGHIEAYFAGRRK